MLCNSQERARLIAGARAAHGRSRSRDIPPAAFHSLPIVAEDEDGAIPAGGDGVIPVGATPGARRAVRFSSSDRTESGFTRGGMRGESRGDSRGDARGNLGGDSMGESRGLGFAGDFRGGFRGGSRGDSLGDTREYYREDSRELEFAGDCSGDSFSGDSREESNGDNTEACNLAAALSALPPLPLPPHWHRVHALRQARAALHAALRPAAVALAAATLRITTLRSQCVHQLQVHLSIYLSIHVAIYLSLYIYIYTYSHLSLSLYIYKLRPAADALAAATFRIATPRQQCVHQIQAH